MADTMANDLSPLLLSLRLSAVTTLVLLAVGTALGWWLAHTRLRLRPLVEAVVALPLVLPPTVLGFYLLQAFGPHGWLGGPWRAATGTGLAFSFAGLVAASVVYSLPFVVQPLQATFEIIGRAPVEAAQVLGASRRDAFSSVVMPLALRGYLTAAVLGFAHTLGEFGVVLMVGGSMPGQTRVVSIAVFDRVEALDYAGAHRLSMALLGLSFAALTLLYALNRRFLAR